MKKRIVAALLVALGATSTGAFVCINQNDQKIESCSAEVEELVSPTAGISLELSKMLFMLEEKEKAEEEYDKILQAENALSVAQKQQSEASVVRSMSANLEELAAQNQKADEIAEKQADEELESIIDSLEQTNELLEEIVEKQNEPISQEALIIGDRVDESYTGTVIEITGENRRKLEGLVQSEAGGEGFTGAALVAQALRDTMVKDGITDVSAIKRKYSYDGSLGKEPNENVKRAVAYIFDEGGIAVQHRIIYFYGFKHTSSSFHERQKFVVEYGGHRFFDKWEN